MRRLWATAVLAVPLLLLASSTAYAYPPDSRGFGGGGVAMKLFPHIHQHGPLYNYGPYYGYYPFKPYGPWDAYLRYDPYFYGDPYAKWGVPEHSLGQRPGPGLGQAQPHQPAEGNFYGWNQNLHRGLPVLTLPSLNLPSIFHKAGCTSCGSWHASWLQGGWFRGHSWQPLPPVNLFHKPGCKSCGGVAQVEPLAPTGDASARYVGAGSPAQSAVYYPALPTLDRTLDVVPVAGQTR